MAAHGDSGDDDCDMLLELLSYECPITGKRRIAGVVDDDAVHVKSFGQIKRQCSQIEVDHWWF